MESALAIGEAVGLALRGPECENDDCYLLGQLTAIDDDGYLVARFRPRPGDFKGVAVYVRRVDVAHVDYFAGKSPWEIKQEAAIQSKQWGSRQKPM